MYVTPRPLDQDDPLFPLRMAAAGVIGWVIGMVSQSYMPMIYPALLIGLLAGMRWGITFTRGVAAPLGFAIVLNIMALIVSYVMVRPEILIFTMFVVFFLAFWITQKTGSPAGMLILIAGVLTSTMAMNSWMMMDILRDNMTKAALWCIVIIPLLYVIFPPKKKGEFKEPNFPTFKFGATPRALIRAFVLILLCLWFYTVLSASNIMMVVAAVFVLVFPSQKSMADEARERTLATLYGAVAALIVLGILTINGHVYVVFFGTAITCLYFGYKMMHGTESPTTYQFAMSTMVSTVGSCLISNEPSYTVMTRLVLTFGGTIAAVYIVLLLERIFLKPEHYELFVYDPVAAEKAKIAKAAAKAEKARNKVMAKEAKAAARKMGKSV